jgi:hypothetical protein
MWGGKLTSGEGFARGRCFCLERLLCEFVKIAFLFKI